ncbi:hypothetical protein GCM10010191_52950 [Actinomadura vinacea]|uniref:SnoaL-like domain-containing protein n=1 Tax=Actinomadura vinacea TaxID=115336 RepID=A0ABP5WNZ9_9ACTN
METIVERYHQAMRDKSADALADLYAEDAVHEFPFSVPGLPPCFEGREAVRAGYRKMWEASPVLVEGIEDVTTLRATDPEVIVVEQVVTGTVGPGGPDLRVPGLLVLRIRDGLIVHCRDYMDGFAVAEARR